MSDIIISLWLAGLSICDVMFRTRYLKSTTHFLDFSAWSYHDTSITEVSRTWKQTLKDAATAWEPWAMFPQPLPMTASTWLPRTVFIGRFSMNLMCRSSSHDHKILSLAFLSSCLNTICFINHPSSLTTGFWWWHAKCFKGNLLMKCDMDWPILLSGNIVISW